MTTGTVALVYGEVSESAPADEKDTLVEVEAVRSALRRLGYTTYDVPVSLDLSRTAAALKAGAPDFAFNLAETVDGKGSLIQLAPTLLESLGIPYTGAPCESIVLTSHKLLGKKTLAAAGVDTPPWSLATRALDDGMNAPFPWIVKSVWEHASIGLEDTAVVRSRDELAREISRRTARESLAHLFVEGFVEGREFNIALLGGESEPEILPPAEIRFIDYPAGKPRLVGYKAKWESGSFEYGGTLRAFDFPSSDGALLDRLGKVSRTCWRLFDLRGYARVDFRVDAEGRPWVLEVNTNPCISPDAGFMAAAERTGLGIEDVVRRIVADTKRTGGSCSG